MTEQKCCEKCIYHRNGNGHVPDMDLPCISKNCECHTPPPTDGWEERLLGIFLECTGMPGKHLAWRDYMVPEIRETITQALAEQKARMVEDLKKICNKSKTERGLAIALGNFIKALSK